MNRYGSIVFLCLLTLGCQGQNNRSSEVMIQSINESQTMAADSLKPSDASTEIEPSIEDEALDTVQAVTEDKNEIAELKIDQEPTTQKVNGQATIWTAEQQAFLQKVNKILLFHVRITDIGSRKLELDSQLGDQAHDMLINTLLDEQSFGNNEEIEGADPNTFVPKYQLLLEGEDDKLTLMFDTEKLEMVVANLFNREHHAITPLMVDCIEKIKKK